MGECDRDDKGGPSIFKVIRSTTTLARMFHMSVGVMKD
jgi:hypothetical protein